jgi:hypothetical protein
MSDEDWVGKDLPVGSMTPANPTRLEQARLFLQFRVADALSADEVRESSFRNLSPGIDRLSPHGFSQDEDILGLQANKKPPRQASGYYSRVSPNRLS